ncbi:hypothetical protein AAFF_G00337310 [Aldrovandia affinis]|uniref:Protein phosphatase 1 regulatory subunit 26 N-terminal domain-containing protein n=1 Tax=Aldrovandia affinis TaxID=143900 RepID=A0AAD7SKU8_9TELE|nr:hypothetical protein AAFF_G00337310 [Aldrovandia affinis]
MALKRQFGITSWRKKKENSEDSKKVYKFLQPNEESNSSDDGIEEAIRHYQLEKQKEEHITKVSELSQPKQTHGSKATALCLDHSGTSSIKKQKVLTKKKKTERTSKPILSTPVAACCTLSRPLDNSDIKDNGVSLTKNKTPSPLKANTTAELMCAEAILDISKAVMPEVFDDCAALPNNCVQSTFHSQDDINCLEKKKKSDESSIDSDDGIEQEIRNFLELKAQMHNQSSGTTSLACTQTPAVAPPQQKKLDPSQNKKLSLSHKRKRKEEDSNIFKGEELDTKLKEPHPQPLIACDSNNIFRTQAASTPEETGIALCVATISKREDPTKNGEQKHSPISLKDAKDPGKEGDSNPSSSKNEVSKSLMLAERRGQTGDKSSSLDSDEDLDAAIKDLLLTKKKVKKKTRDRKLKSKKMFGAVELCLVEELQSEKPKTLTEYKTVSNPKIPKTCIPKCNKVTPKQNTNGRSIKPKKNKNTSEQLKTDKQVKPSCQAEQTGQEKEHTNVEPLSGGSNLGATQVEEDSSSVDSDDSIEQEIRKFLAEKAKLSMVKTKDGGEIRDSSTNATDSRTEGGIKLEPQQAEIWEGEVLQSASPSLEGHIPHSVDKQSSPLVANTSNSSSSLQADREGDTVKALKNKVILKKSNTEKISPDVEKVTTVHKVSPVSPKSNTEPIFAHQAISLTEMEVPMSQSPFHISPPIPMTVREVKETSISDLHGVICNHQTRSFVPSHDASGSICPAVGNHENITQDEIIEPSPQPPETSTAASPSFPTPTPARQPGEHFLLGQARGGSLGQNTAPCLPENVVQIKMDQPLFLELSSHGSYYVQMRNRDLCKAGNNKDCTRETEDRKREEGDLVSEGEEECIDETDDESDERSSGSQRSRERKPFPRLCLSTTIDPGESFKPYIILNSPERNLKYSKRCVWVGHQQSDKLKMPASSHKQVTPKEPERINPNYAVNVKTFYSKITPCAVPLTKNAKKKKLIKRQLQFHTQLPRKEERIAKKYNL